MRGFMPFILPLSALIIISGCISGQAPIGGERDEHGCLIAAGYSFNATVNACIREWELDESQREAAGIAVEHVGYESGLTILEVLPEGCEGCYTVRLEKGTDRLDVVIEGWVVMETSLTPDQCTSLGGHPVDTVGGVACPEGETDVGNVTGFISPNICCIAILDFQDCADAGFPVMESYPRQCRVGSRLFVEDISLSLEEARAIAEASICTEQGGLTGSAFHNDITGTWWFDLDIEQEGCAPACVVYDLTREAEINWRCTGLLP